jgi:hypothetical protein
MQIRQYTLAKFVAFQSVFYVRFLRNKKKEHVKIQFNGFQGRGRGKLFHNLAELYYWHLTIIVPLR